MNIATTRGTTSRAMSLPNILTYGRIAAIPVVVGCIYAQSIMDSPLWLRWVAAGVELSLAQRLAFFGAMLWKQFWQPLAAICLFFFMLTAHFIGFIAQRKSL